MNQHPNTSPVLHDVELSELHAAPSSQGAAVLPSRLGLFSAVKATVQVCAGQAESTVGELLALKEGALLTLDRQIDAPFDVVLDGKVMARGQLVAVGEHFGIRITEVCELPQ